MFSIYLTIWNKRTKLWSVFFAQKSFSFPRLLRGNPGFVVRGQSSSRHQPLQRGAEGRHRPPRRLVFPWPAPKRWEFSARVKNAFFEGTGKKKGCWWRRGRDEKGVFSSGFPEFFPPPNNTRFGELINAVKNYWSPKFCSWYFEIYSEGKPVWYVPPLLFGAALSVGDRPQPLLYCRWESSMQGQKSLVSRWYKVLYEGARIS